MSASRTAISTILPIITAQADELWRATLPEEPWSPRLRVVSVSAGTELASVWSAEDLIPLMVAVVCSTAAPSAAPLVVVADSIWIYDGVRSGTNTGLLTNAPGHVLVLAHVPCDDLVNG